MSLEFVDLSDCFQVIVKLLCVHDLFSLLKLNKSTNNFILNMIEQNSTDTPIYPNRYMRLDIDYISDNIFNDEQINFISKIVSVELNIESKNKLDENHYIYRHVNYLKICENETNNYFWENFPNIKLLYAEKLYTKNELFLKCKNIEELTLSEYFVLSNSEILNQITNLTKLKSFISTHTLYTDLSFLFNCTMLLELHLFNSKIKSIDVVRHLPMLKLLNISHTKITDINPIRELKNLTLLDICNLKLDDIGCLSYCTSLTRLKMISTKIKNKNNIAYCKSLEVLYSVDTGINVNFSNHLIQELDLGHNNLKGIYLGPCINLKKLNMCGNYISDLSPIKDFTNLTELYLDHNNITDIEPLEKLINLVNLNLDHNNITNIETLKYCKKLISLGLSNNKIRSIYVLRFCEKLENLHLNNNKIKDIKSISKNKKLKYLYLDYNRLTSLDGLSSENNIDYNLEYLSADNNKIKDISGIAYCLNIDSLFLSYNQNIDLSYIKHCSRLQFINLNNNELININSLCDMKKLYNIIIYDTNFTHEEIRDIKKSIKSVNIVYLPSNEFLDDYEFEPEEEHLHYTDRSLTYRLLEYEK
jgi:internalin A